MRKWEAIQLIVNNYFSQHGGDIREPTCFIGARLELGQVKGRDTFLVPQISAMSEAAAGVAVDELRKQTNRQNKGRVRY